MTTNDFTRWHRLDDLRRKLMFYGYEGLGLTNLEPLRIEVATKEAEARTGAFKKAGPAGEEGS